MKKLCTALTFLIASISSGQMIVLKAARMFDGTTDTVTRNAVVVIDGKRITAISPASIAPNARVIDLGDVTLLPGFIDSHVHLTEEFGDNWYQDYFQTLMRQPAEQALLATTFARKTIEAGFTTVRNVGAGDYVDIGLRNAINNGWVVGPRMLVSGYAIGSTGGHGDSDPIPPARGFQQSGPMQGVCNGVGECRAAVRYQIKYGADVIKFMPSGGVLSLSDPVDAPELSQDEMNAIVEEAHHWGRKAAAHCHGDAAARMAIQAGVDSIEHGSFIKPETLAMMREKGTYLVPTLLAGEWTGGRADKFPPVIAAKARAAVAARSDMFRNALKAGVKIAFGTDSAVSPHGMNGKEFALMTGLGMSPAAALRSATQSAAALLGVDDRLGTIATGKLADIIAVPGNPLDDIHQTEFVVFVMKEGQIVKNAPAR
ncbi:MAG: amidohydrolase family protein [Acidobacteriota bacterium]|nr:amidohydrolase family protein [Acidobacteriota bacterium]